MPDQKIKLIIEALDKTQPAINSLKGSVDGLKTKFEGIGTVFKAVAAAAPFAALVNEIKHVVSAGEDLLKISQQIGISVEHLAGLKHAAELSEASIADLTIGMKGLAQALSGSSEMGKDTTQILKALGVTAKDPYDALLQIADAFAKMKDGAGKTSIAVDLFGRSGLSLIPLLNEGSTGIRSMHDEAERLGIVISTDTAKKFDEFGDNVIKLKANFTGLATTIANSVIPAVNKLFYIFSDQGAAEFRLSGIQRQIESLQKIVDTGKFMGFSVSEGTIAAHRRSIERLQLERNSIIGKHFLAPAPAAAKSDAPYIPGAGAAGGGRTGVKAVIKEEEEALEELGHYDMQVAAAVTEYEKEQEQKRLDAFFAAINEKKAAAQRYQSDWEAINDEMAEADGRYLVKLVEAVPEVQDAFDGIKTAIESVSGALADFVMTGEMNFKQFADSVIRDFIRIRIEQELLYAASGGKQGSSWVGSALSFVSELWHAGGVPGVDSPVSYRVVPAAAFSAAPRYHGGIGPGERRAIIKDEEGVFTPGQMAALGKGASGSQAATNIIINAVDAKSFADMCRRNPDAINNQIMQALRDNKTRSEFKRLVN